MGSVKASLTRYWFVIYVLSALLVLGAFLNLGIHFGPRLESWLIAKLVPEIWHSTVDDLLHRFFREEHRAFLVTTGFGLGIILIGLTLFPLKEKLSSTYEEERFPDLAKKAPPPLWQQGLEEVKLAVLYLLLQGLSLFLTLQGNPVLAFLSTALSIAYLVGAMTLDHCSYFFQRRGRQIHGIIWILLRYAPLRAALLGLICIGPVLLLEKVLPSNLNPTIAISLLVFTEVLGMAFATLLGCHLGAVLVRKNPGLAEQPPPQAWTISYRGVILGLAGWMIVFFGWWTHRAYRHYGYMQCRYKPLWQETRFKLRDTRVLVTFPIQIDNRSTRIINPTELQIEFVGEGIVDGSAIVRGSKIPTGSKAILQLEFEARLSENALLDLPGFLEAGYSAHLKFAPPLSRPVLFKIFPQ